MKNLLKAESSPVVGEVKRSGRLFQPASPKTLDLIRTFNQEQKNTFLMPAKFISAEAGQVGYLLNEYFNVGRVKGQRGSYKTFFCNSCLEAVHGAIKIARHNAFKRNKNHPRKILIFDPGRKMEMFFNPLGRDASLAMVPGLRFVAEKTQLLEIVKKRGGEFCGVIVSASQDLVHDVFDACRSKNIITILDETNNDFRIAPSLVHQVKILPDVILTAEGLTDYEIPFGAFSMSDAVHQVWRSMQTCFIHSSTFGGNRLSLAKARDHLLEVCKDDQLREKCLDIEADRERCLEAFSQYINPAIVGFFRINGFDFTPASAHGSVLSYVDEKRREVIDCISGGGAAVRGHTPDDLPSEVLDTHDHETDYWEKLKNKMSALTGLHKAFPAVSGASAVENGMILAMLANSDKTRIVTFRSNYAGKTMISLNASDLKELDIRSPYLPLYFDVVLIDPFAKDALEQLRQQLTSGQVALVWFEMIQGGTEKSISAQLLDLIASHKAASGYFVGVDEILTGFYRARGLFSYQGTAVAPDIVTSSKALSDGSFPIGTTMVSQEIYDKALRCHPELVDYLENFYVNQLGAHIACHCVEKISSPEMGRHVKKISQIIRTGLNDIAKESSIIREVCGEGVLLHIYYRSDHIFMKCLGKLATMVFPLYMCRVALKEANVFLFFDRCMPALTMSEEEAKTVVSNLKKVFTRNLFVTYLGFCQFFLKLVNYTVISFFRKR